MYQHGDLFGKQNKTKNDHSVIELYRYQKKKNPRRKLGEHFPKHIGILSTTEIYKNLPGSP